MTTVFAGGKRAFGFCDRCYARYPLGALSFQVVARRPTGLRVCRACNDADHPQLLLGAVPIVDPVALRDPRPDIDPGRGLFGWAPVGNGATVMTADVGTAHVWPL